MREDVRTSNYDGDGEEKKDIVEMTETKVMSRRRVGRAPGQELRKNDLFICSTRAVHMSVQV